MKIFKMMDESTKVLIAFIAMAVLLLCLFLCIGIMFWTEGVIVGIYYIIYLLVLLFVLHISKRKYRMLVFLLCVLTFSLSLYSLKLAREKTDAILTRLQNIERLLELDKE